MNMDSDCRVRISPDVLRCQVDDDIVVLTPQSTHYCVLNATASRLWTAFEAGLTIRQVRDSLVAGFDITEQQCERDIHEFLERMTELGVMHIVDDQA